MWKPYALSVTLMHDSTTDMVDSVKREKVLLSLFYGLWFNSSSRAQTETGPVVRRLITLIYAGWLPPDLASSRSCLSLSTGVSAAASSPRMNEGSPYRGRARWGLKIFVFFFTCAFVFVFLCL